MDEIFETYLGYEDLKKRKEIVETLRKEKWSNLFINLFPKDFENHFGYLGRFFRPSPGPIP